MGSASLFKFELWPISDVLLWTNSKNEKTLGWFGLTDGWYTMDCGGVEIMQHDASLGPANPQWGWRTHYFDYQIARLYDDLLQLLPHAVRQVPSDIVDHVRSREAEEILRQCDPPPGDQNYLVSDLSGDATSWWFPDRQLSCGHMVGQPDISIWREHDTVTVRWTNDGSKEKKSGKPWNPIGDGEIVMPVGDFINEVKSFHDRLFGQMSERLSAACEYWAPQGVIIDLSKMRREHMTRAQGFDVLMLEIEDWPGDDDAEYWAEVREAIVEVKRLLGF